MISLLRHAVPAAVFLLVSALLPPPALAQGAPREIALTPAQKDIVHRVETYLNGITTLQSTFFQQSSTNEFAEGSLYLSRPGRMRIEYKPPNPVLIVATGDYLSYIDKDVKNVTHIPVADTPAAFLLDERISLDSKRVAFHEVAQENGAIFVTVAERADPFAGRLTLIFRTNPLSLRKWTVVDAQGIITDVVLTDPFYGGRIDPKLFDVPEFERARSGD
ncbi:MAG: hypothetical protein COW30_08685 [Rhodospirillales bacterium CG15_BIG_FIL_POST_REV_8_21_14_020_66_15]|nr:MAG: hypothetical protein COW30_08685 [Rhodospirillales bacterium CG15_BIG_FIL_POST_REV_8_21_14_020_66_15]